MASNYLQHAHCEVGSEFNHSPNFTGSCSISSFSMWVIIPLTTQDRIHWTELPAMHKELQSRIHPELCKSSFIGYILYDLGIKPVLRVFQPKNTP